MEILFPQQTLVTQDLHRKYHPEAGGNNAWPKKEATYILVSTDLSDLLSVEYL